MKEEEEAKKYKYKYRKDRTSVYLISIMKPKSMSGVFVLQSLERGNLGDQNCGISKSARLLSPHMNGNRKEKKGQKITS